MDRRRRQRVRRTLLSGAIGLSAASVLVIGGDLLADDDVREPEAELRFLPEDDESEQPLTRGADLGAVVPTTRFELLDGGLASLSDYRGRPMVLNFFGSWCPPCRAEMPAFEEVHQQLGDKVAFVGLAVRDSLESARALVKETGVTYDTGRDPAGKMAAELETLRWPTTYLVDAEGRVVSVHPGELTATELTLLIEDHLR